MYLPPSGSSEDKCNAVSSATSLPAFNHRSDDVFPNWERPYHHYHHHHHQGIVHQPSSHYDDLHHQGQQQGLFPSCVFVDH
jgi:hypothetical protein